MVRGLQYVNYREREYSMGADRGCLEAAMCGIANGDREEGGIQDMDEIRLAEAESRFVELIWQREPIPSGELVALCEQELNWKKSTTYTVLRRLCQKGILQNEGSVVTSRIKKGEYKALCSEQVLEDVFEGSLPQFVAAFMSRKKLNRKQVDEIQALIDNYRGE